MTKDYAEGYKLQSFQNRKFEADVWTGGFGTGDEIDFIGGSIATSPRKAVKKREKPMPDYMPLSSSKHVDKVVFYDADKGYGRIGNAGLFFHVSNVIDGNGSFIRCGVMVGFEEGTGRGGREMAVDVQLVGEA